MEILSITSIENKIDRLGESQVYVLNKANEQRANKLNDNTILEQTYEYIFGGKENPLQDITDEQYKRQEEIEIEIATYSLMASKQTKKKKLR